MPYYRVVATIQSPGNEPVEIVYGHRHTALRAASSVNMILADYDEDRGNDGTRYPLPELLAINVTTVEGD